MSLKNNLITWKLARRPWPPCYVYYFESGGLNTRPNVSVLFACAIRFL